MFHFFRMPLLLLTTLASIGHSAAQAGLEKTEVLILGTSHLQHLEGFEPDMLSAVIERLDGLNFDVVCVEKMSGQLLYDIDSRNDTVFSNRGIGEYYLRIANTVQAQTGLGFLEARQQCREILRRPALTAEDRRDLFYCFLAVTDLPSAALQLTHLGPATDTVLTSDFDQYLVKLVQAASATHNEYYSLALPLALRRGLNRLFPIDNLQDEALLMDYYPSFPEDVSAIADEVERVLGMPVYQRIETLTKEGIAQQDLSALYAFLNSPEYVGQDYAAQWAVWLRTDFASGSDRGRYSLWEMRNLQIAANILRVIAQHPGRRVLVIIGASHKGFVEKHLRQIKDIGILAY